MSYNMDEKGFSLSTLYKTRRVLNKVTYELRELLGQF